MNQQRASFLSLNVRGASNFKKRRTIFTWARRKRADIVLLQETHSTGDMEKTWKGDWGGNVYFSHGKSNARGVCIMVRKGLDFEVEKEVSDNSGRFILLKANLEGENVYVVNVYAPNNETKAVDYFHKVNLLLQKENIDAFSNIIMGGDFNCALNPFLDRKSVSSNMSMKHPLVNAISELMRTFDLQDLWRIRNPTLKSYTWSHRTKIQFSRIDYWLTSSSLQECIGNIDIIGAVKSDHSAISLTLNKQDDDIRGPGFWKFNCQLLEDENYVAEVEKMIGELAKTKETDFQNPNAYWEWLKYNFRKHGISYSKKKAFERRNKEFEIEKNLKKAKASFENNPSMAHRLEIQKNQDLLDGFYEEKAKGARLRAKVRWYENGERSTKYFFNLEKRNAVKKCIKKLNVDGRCITKQNEILKHQKEFYQNLYSSQDNDCSENDILSFLSNSSFSKLNDELRNSCEGKITPEECDEVLKSFENNKSPGNDGITIELYKKFWSSLKPLLIESYNFSFGTSLLPISQRQSIITLIEKKDSDKMLLKNWRPVSLLNVDYKILSKVLAYRLKRTLPMLIHHCQTGYVKNRFIGEVVRLIEDVMDYTDQRNVSGLMVFIDFEKAFDTVNRTFLLNVLKPIFGFGPSFCSWINTLFKCNLASVCNNGFSSQYFDLGRGVKQGDPISPYLFILGAEILSLVIRHKASIKGIHIGNEEIKLAQFADDTTTFLKDSASLKSLLNTMDLFEKISGLKINLNKTEALGLGPLKNKDFNICGIKSSKQVKALGVHFSYDKKVKDRLNFSELPSQISRIINIWKQRNLTFFGKITLIKSLLLSKLTYKATMLSVPPQIVTEIKTIVFRFLWNSKDKIKRKVVCNEFKRGGLRMVDIDNMIKSLKLTWISRLVASEKRPWKNYLQQALQKAGGYKLFLRSNYDISRRKDLSLSSFYLEVLKYWKDLRDQCIINNDELIWNNKNILVNNFPVFYKNFSRIGINSLQDLFPISRETTAREAFDFWVKKGLNKNCLTFYKFLVLRQVARVRRNCLENANMYDNNENDPILIRSKHSDFFRNVSIFKAKHYYNILKEITAITIPTRWTKLKSDFNLSDEDLESVYGLPFNTANENKLREMHFQNFKLYCGN